MAAKKNSAPSTLPSNAVSMGMPLKPGSAFAGIHGQDGALSVLTAALAHGRLSHAYFFVGPHGVGRELAARRLAAALLCTGRSPGAAPHTVCGTCGACARVDRMMHPDVQLCIPEAEAVARGLPFDEDRKPSMEIKVDQIRRLRDAMHLTAFEGGWRVALIPQAEKLRVEAANALLKTLEEPQARTLLVLGAPDRGAILETLRSRCQRVAFSPLPPSMVKHILMERTLPESAAAVLASQSQGSMVGMREGEGDAAAALAQEAQTLLDQLHTGTPTQLLSAAERLEKEREKLDRLMRTLMRLAMQQAEKHLATVSRQGSSVLRARGLLGMTHAAEQLRRELLIPGINVRLSLERFLLEAHGSLGPC